MKVNIKWSICRICLEEVGNSGTSIFDYDEISMKIRECGGINIYKKSNLPSHICKTCLLHLNIAHRFRCLCQSSDEKLQTFLNKSEILNKNVTTDCSFIEIDDILNQKTIEESLIENDDDQYFIYYADAEELDENELISESNQTEVILPNLKQEYTLDEEYIIQTDEVPANNDSVNLMTDTKHEVNYEVNLNAGNEMKIFDDKLSNVDISVKTENNEESKTQNEYRVVETTGSAKTVREKKKYTKKIKHPNGEEQKFVCDVCGNQYDKRYTLQQHMKWHSDEKPYACEICKKAFVTEYQIHRHMRAHTGEKPYKCKFCDRKFSDASTRMKHERIHTNTRPFKCDVCDKSFNYSDVLRVHKMTHSGEKPYSCELCGKRFSQMHHLKAHRQTLSHRAMVENEAY